MAATVTPRVPSRSKRVFGNSSSFSTPSSKSPQAKQQRSAPSGDEIKEDKSDLILQRLDEIEDSIMAKVSTLLDDFKSKLEMQMKEEMTKLYDRMIVQTNKEVDEKLKKVQEEFNSSTNFIQMSLKEEIAAVREHALHNEQYSRKNSVRVFGITEDDGENVEGKVIEFFKVS